MVYRYMAGEYLTSPFRRDFIDMGGLLSLNKLRPLYVSCKASLEEVRYTRVLKGFYGIGYANYVPW